MKNKLAEVFEITGVAIMGLGAGGALVMLISHGNFMTAMCVLAGAFLLGMFDLAIAQVLQLLTDLNREVSDLKSEKSEKVSIWK